MSRAKVAAGVPQARYWRILGGAGAAVGSVIPI
jgi:hypothetical protein